MHGWAVASLLAVFGTPSAPYPERVDRIERARAHLAAQATRSETARREVRERARALLVAAIGGELFPAWLGTPWAYHGTTETPGRGHIACGYFVSTILRDAGLRVERVRLAQQASERIIRSLVSAPRIRRFSDRPLAEVLAAVRAQGEGLYLVGLDNHVGFLLHHGGEIAFCHASYLPPAVVTCEPALEAPALRSRYVVLGGLFEDALVDRWLRGARIPTR